MGLRKILENLRFISSSDLDIVASDQKTQELFLEASSNGTAPGKTCKIQILGDERAGKTSLRKKLMGERFDPKEPPTFGIDTRFCKVSEIDESWRERVDETGSEYERVLSWVLANDLTKWRKSHETDEVPKSTATRLFRWTMTAVLVTLSLCGMLGIVLLSVVLSSFMTASSFCYLLVVLSGSSVFVTKKSDMYRVGVGLAIFVPLVHVLFGTLFYNHNETKNEDCLSITISLLAIWLVSGTLFGFACGFGLRTGVAAGVLLMLTPTASDKADAGLEKGWQDHVSFLVATQLCVCIGCGMAFGVGTSALIPSISKKLISNHTKVPKGVSNFAHVLIILSVLFSQPSLRTSELNRIKFWMTSVYQHANSPLFLVGTHLDCIDSDDLEQIRKYLDTQLFSQRYPFLQNLIVNKASPFFCIDNSGTLVQLSQLTDDTVNLRDAIRRESEHAKPMNQEYPIRWRRFLDFVKAKHKSLSSTREQPFISLSNLKKNNTDEFGFSDAKEINEMLKFFNSSGEILYDSVDSILRQFIILQPQFLVDIMEE
ncbi:uncharacterized protein [Amphiura filiformis]|uniref:uncharacterized protein n=1 Tax=Amphiura filiformis TaxID=82378 RepID=UPI003B2149B2